MQPTLRGPSSVRGTTISSMLGSGGYQVIVACDDLMKIESCTSVVKSSKGQSFATILRFMILCTLLVPRKLGGRTATHVPPLQYCSGVHLSLIHI